LVGSDGSYTGGRVGKLYDPNLWVSEGAATPPPAPPSVPGFSTTMDEQFLTSTIDTTSWLVHTDAFGNTAGQDQQWLAANVVPGSTLAGATSGKGLMLIPRKPATPVNGHVYTAGMIDSQGVGKLHPLWGRYKIRLQTAHYQGLWGAFWLTCPGAAGGATRMEIDLFEYFFAQLVGKNSITVWGWGDTAGVSQAANPGIGLPTAGEKYTNNGNSGRASRTLFETVANLDTPQWHTFEVEIMPVTDSTGATVGDITVMASQNVRMKFWTDGVLNDTFVDTHALQWTGSTQGGLTVNNFFNIYLQGYQMGGKYVGNVAGPLGYSDKYATDNGGNGCFNGGGPASNACTVVANGNRLADFTTAGADSRLALKVDYIQVLQAV
jgi:beta-glucanase (GH16 family)